MGNVVGLSPPETLVNNLLLEYRHLSLNQVVGFLHYIQDTGLPYVIDEVRFVQALSNNVQDARAHFKMLASQRLQPSLDVATLVAGMFALCVANEKLSSVSRLEQLCGMFVSGDSQHMSSSEVLAMLISTVRGVYLLTHGRSLEMDRRCISKLQALTDVIMRICVDLTPAPKLNLSVADRGGKGTDNAPDVPKLFLRDIVFPSSRLEKLYYMVIVGNNQLYDKLTSIERRGSVVQVEDEKNGKDSNDKGDRKFRSSAAWQRSVPALFHGCEPPQDIDCTTLSGLMWSQLRRRGLWTDFLSATRRVLQKCDGGKNAATASSSNPNADAASFNRDHDARTDSKPRQNPAEKLVQNIRTQILHSVWPVHTPKGAWWGRTPASEDILPAPGRAQYSNRASAFLWRDLSVPKPGAESPVPLPSGGAHKQLVSVKSTQFYQRVCAMQSGRDLRVPTRVVAAVLQDIPMVHDWLNYHKGEIDVVTVCNLRDGALYIASLLFLFNWKENVKDCAAERSDDDTHTGCDDLYGVAFQTGVCPKCNPASVAKPKEGGKAGHRKRGSRKSATIPSDSSDSIQDRRNARSWKRVQRAMKKSMKRDRHSLTWRDKMEQRHYSQVWRDTASRLMREQVKSSSSRSKRKKGRGDKRASVPSSPVAVVNKVPIEYKHVRRYIDALRCQHSLWQDTDRLQEMDAAHSYLLPRRKFAVGYQGVDRGRRECNVFHATMQNSRPPTSLEKLQLGCKMWKAVGQVRSKWVHCMFAEVSGGEPSGALGGPTGASGPTDGEQNVDIPKDEDPSFSQVFTGALCTCTACRISPMTPGSRFPFMFEQSSLVPLQNALSKGPQASSDANSSAYQAWKWACARVRRRTFFAICDAVLRVKLTNREKRLIASACGKHITMHTGCSLLYSLLSFDLLDVHGTGILSLSRQMAVLLYVVLRLPPTQHRVRVEIDRIEWLNRRLERVDETLANGAHPSNNEKDVHTTTDTFTRALWLLSTMHSFVQPEMSGDRMGKVLMYFHQCATQVPINEILYKKREAAQKEKAASEQRHASIGESSRASVSSSPQLVPVVVTTTDSEVSASPVPPRGSHQSTTMLYSPARSVATASITSSLGVATNFSGPSLRAISAAQQADENDDTRSSEAEGAADEEDSRVPAAELKTNFAEYLRVNDSELLERVQGTFLDEPALYRLCMEVVRQMYRPLMHINTTRVPQRAILASRLMNVLSSGFYFETLLRIEANRVKYPKLAVYVKSLALVLRNETAERLKREQAEELKSEVSGTEFTLNFDTAGGDAEVLPRVAELKKMMKRLKAKWSRKIPNKFGGGAGGDGSTGVGTIDRSALKSTRLIFYLEFFMVLPHLLNSIADSLEWLFFCPSDIDVAFRVHLHTMDASVTAPPVDIAIDSVNVVGATRNSAKGGANAVARKGLRTLFRQSPRYSLLGSAQKVESDFAGGDLMMGFSKGLQRSHKPEKTEEPSNSDAKEFYFEISTAQLHWYFTKLCTSVLHKTPASRKGLFRAMDNATNYVLDFVAECYARNAKYMLADDEKRDEALVSMDKFTAEPEKLLVHEWDSEQLCLLDACGRRVVTADGGRAAGGTEGKTSESGDAMNPDSTVDLFNECTDIQSYFFGSVGLGRFSTDSWNFRGNSGGVKRFSQERKIAKPDSTAGNPGMPQAYQDASSLPGSAHYRYPLWLLNVYIRAVVISCAHLRSWLAVEWDAHKGVYAANHLATLQRRASRSGHFMDRAWRSWLLEINQRCAQHAEAVMMVERARYVAVARARMRMDPAHVEEYEAGLQRLRAKVGLSKEDDDDESAATASQTANISHLHTAHNVSHTASASHTAEQHAGSSLEMRSADESAVSIASSVAIVRPHSDRTTMHTGQSSKYDESEDIRSSSQNQLGFGKRSGGGGGRGGRGGRGGGVARPRFRSGRSPAVTRSRPITLPAMEPPSNIATFTIPQAVLAPDPTKQGAFKGHKVRASPQRGAASPLPE